jgi:hypothetical protein
VNYEPSCKAALGAAVVCAALQLLLALIPQSPLAISGPALLYRRRDYIPRWLASECAQDQAGGVHRQQHACEPADSATNAAGLVLNQLGNSRQDKKIDVGNQFVADAANYVLKAAPDAVTHSGLAPQAIAEKILALLPQESRTRP